jgi:actin-like ATPase involved in cell morphogenesis
MHDEYDSKAVIERLLEEIRSVRAALTLVEKELYCDERIRRMSLTGGIAALRRQRDEAEAEVKALNKELDLIIKRGK